MSVQPLGRMNAGQTSLSTGAGSAIDARFQGQPEAIKSVGEQIQESLFSRPAPMLLEPSAYPELMQMLVVLNTYRRKLAMMIGDRDQDYSFALAQDTIAAIDERGIIFLGAQFLLSHKNNLDVVVGAIAHEIGHRPKRMRQLARQDTRELTVPEKQALLLHEEIRADSFAGRGLAELGFSCEPLIEFLRQVSVHPHPEYLGVEQRAEVIRAGFTGRQMRAESRRKLFPDFDRHTAPRMHLGEY